MSLQIIDVGSIANDNTGEPLRDAFVKVNENFSELYTQTLGTGDNLIIVGNSLEATNTNGNVELVPNGSGIIKLSNVVVDGDQIRCSPVGTLTLDTTTAINSLNVTGGFSVGGASNLGPVGNVTITGGTAGYALTTNGSGVLIWSPVALISGATGVANRLAYFPTTGSNIADTSANLTWNGANLLTVTGNVSTGNVIAGNLTVGADRIISANTIITIDPSSTGVGGTVIIEGNLQVTGTTTTVNSTTVEVADLNLTLAKNAATAADANGAGLTVAGASATITYVLAGDKWALNKSIDATGSITGSTTLSITGNANLGNLGTAGLITATGNVSGGNLITAGVLSVTGNATVGNISATNANVTAITATGNANVGNLGTSGLITSTGNITGGNLITGGVLSVTGNATVGNIGATNANVTAITATGNANVGNLGAAAGVFTGNITAGNINSVSGILSVTGNANLGNLGAGAGVFTGGVTVTGNLSGGNISTLGVLNVTGNANVGNIGAGAAVLAGPLSGVTTIGASGNANVGNIGSLHSIHTGNGSFGNINSVSGILSVTGNANVGNIGATAAVLAGPLSGVTTINASGNANVGNIGATNSVVTANATFGNINSVSGILSVTGNANVGNIGAGAAVLAGPLSGVTTINASGNANVGNIGATRGVFTSIVGNLETTAQSNITVVGTLTGLTVSGNFNAQANVFVTSNITAGNINSVSGILSVTGNANVGNIGAGAAVLAGPLSGVTTINASGNANVGNLGAAAGVFTSNVSVTGNISAGNISTTGVLSVTGNANVGNLGVAGLITATGNITGANITSNGNISTSNLDVTNLSNLGNVGNVKITGGSTDYVLKTDGAGNLSWVAAGLISGNVNVGTSTRLAYYATTGQTISDTGANLTWNGSNLLTVTGNISAGNVSGTLTTAAQPNVTSVGSLSSLTVTGNLSAGNISTTGVLSVTGNANVGNLGATNIVGTLATNAQPNVTSVGNLVALTAGLTNITASTDSTSTTTGALVVTGGVGIGGNLHVGGANRAHIITGNVTITGNITVTGNQNIIGSNNISYTDNILELHNQANSAPWTTDDGKDVGIRVHYYKGADKHAFFGWSNDAQSLEYYYDGTESGGVFSGSYGTFKGNVFHSTATTGTAPFTVNSTTQVANLHAALAGSVTGNAQANITSVGTLTSLSVTGNANVGNLGAAAGVFTGAITGSTTLNVTGNANVGNIGATRGVFSNIAGTLETASQINITAVGTLSDLTVSGNITANANVIVTSNITAGNINSVSGILNVTGNANVGNIGATRGVFSNIAGTLETAAQPSVTSVGTLSSLTVSGNTALATSSGNVGIGTASPVSKLEVFGSVTAREATTQDSVILAGRAGGTSSFGVTLTPTTLTASRTVTLADGNTTLTTGTMAVTGGNLAQFAATTSAQLAGVISDETGTGSLVFGTSPTITTSAVIPLVIGGTTVSSTLTLQSTSGAGAGDAIIFRTGSQIERMRILAGGNIGIRTTVPTAALSVNGNVTVTTALIVNGITLSRGAGSDTNSTSVGAGALVANTTGTQNTAVGKNSLQSNGTGFNNNAFGYTSLFNNTTGEDNAGFGALSMYANVDGSFNSALGVYTLYKNVHGSYNFAAGHSALFNNLIGGTNTAVGRESLYSNTIGNNNTAVGAGALYDLGEVTTAGAFLIGYDYYIVTIGTTDFTLIGAASNTVGELFTASGVGAGDGTASANNQSYNNTVIGYGTGGGIISGNNNTIIGANVTGLAADLSNTIILADGDGNKRIYVDSSGNVGIGTASPAHKLDVLGASAKIYAGGTTTDTILHIGNSDVASPGQGGFLVFHASAATPYFSINALSQGVAYRNIALAHLGGNVGIGTTSPAGKLDVVGGRSFFSAASEPYGVGVRYVSTGGAVYFGATNGTATPDAQISAAGGGALMTLQNGGNVGIGTTSPGAKLSVEAGNIGIDGNGSAQQFFGAAGNFAGTNTTGGVVTVFGHAPNAQTNLATPPFDGTNFVGAAGIITRGFSESSQYRGSLEFFTETANTPASRMLITHDGNVGIGTASPGTKLHVGAVTVADGNVTLSAGTNMVYTVATSGAALTWNASTNGGNSNTVMAQLKPRQDTGANYNLDVFAGTWNNNNTPGTAIATFQSTGNVGIGLTNPAYKLEIVTDSAGKPGVGGLWTVVSDERIKTDITPADLDRCYEIVRSVPLKHFGFAPGVYTDDQINDKHSLGWIAQDVQKVFSKAVSVKPFTLKTAIPDGTEEYTEQDFTVETVEKTETSIQVIDGKPVQVSKVVTSENKVLLFDTVDVVDEAGAVVMDGDKPLTYQMPRMVTKTRNKVRHDVIEDCLDLNGGQMIAALYGAVQALMLQVESLKAGN